MFAGVSGADERIRLWVDSSLVVDLWRNLSGTEGSGIFSFSTANVYHDLLLEYKQSNASFGARISWSHFSTKQVLQPRSFGWMTSLRNSPVSFNFKAGPVSREWTELVGNALTLATSCIENIFTVHARDTYGNVAHFGFGGITIQMFPLTATGHVVQQKNILGNGEISAPCRQEDAGVCTVSYKLNTAGRVLLSVRIQVDSAGNDVSCLHVRGSPFELLVLPGPFDRSVAGGNGLSVITAGLPATFTITAKDCSWAPIDVSALVSSVTMRKCLGDMLWIQLPFETQPTTIGTLKMSYKHTKSGSFFLSVQVRGVHVLGSPFTVQSFAEPASPSMTTVLLTTTIATAGQHFFCKILIISLFLPCR
jgi:hypothetical protein